MITDVLRFTTRLSDTELLAQVQTLAAAERESTARLIAMLAEFDARRLYLGQGCASLFTYGGQCAFIGTAGRCTERTLLEYHHRIPYADGGSTTAENLELRCRAHNAYEAERWFGSDVVRETTMLYGSDVGTIRARRLAPDRVGATKGNGPDSSASTLTFFCRDCRPPAALRCG